VDFVTYNTHKPSKALLKKYERDSELVSFDELAREKRHYRVVKTNLLSSEEIRFSKGDKIAHTRAFIRHDAEKLGKVLMMLLELGEYENILHDIV
jgi:hypothetical protein